jgi:hypothetical protein
MRWSGWALLAVLRAQFPLASEDEHAAGRDMLGLLRVEGGGGAPPKRTARRGTFKSVDTLKNAIGECLAEYDKPPPFVWTKMPTWFWRRWLTVKMRWGHHTSGLNSTFSLAATARWHPLQVGDADGHTLGAMPNGA